MLRRMVNLTFYRMTKRWGRKGGELSDSWNEVCGEGLAVGEGESGKLAK